MGSVFLKLDPHRSLKMRMSWPISDFLFYIIGPWQHCACIVVLFALRYCSFSLRKQSCSLSADQHISLCLSSTLRFNPALVVLPPLWFSLATSLSFREEKRGEATREGGRQAGREGGRGSGAVSVVLNSRVFSGCNDRLRQAAALMTSDARPCLSQQ